RPIPDELQDDILGLWVTRKQVHRFGEHRLADEERRVEFVEAFCDPMVVLFRPVEKRDQRSGINDGDGHRGRSLRDAWDSKRDQDPRNGSGRVRAWSARQGWDGGAFCAVLQGRAAAPPRPGPGACGRAARPPPWLDGRARRALRLWSSLTYPWPY